jgi:hypothetical protein
VAPRAFENEWSRKRPVLASVHALPATPTPHHCQPPCTRINCPVRWHTWLRRRGPGGWHASVRPVRHADARVRPGHRLRSASTRFRCWDAREGGDRLGPLRLICVSAKQSSAHRVTPSSHRVAPRRLCYAVRVVSGHERQITRAKRSILFSVQLCANSVQLCVSLIIVSPPEQHSKHDSPPRYAG